MDYSFLYSEVWWMETIIAALITAFASCIGFICLYNYKIKKLCDEISDMRSEHKGLSSEHKGLSSEHKGLSGEHKELSGEHKELSGEHRNISDKIINVQHIIEASFKDDAYRYENLKESQKALIDNSDTIINVIQSMRNEILTLQGENKQLRILLQKQNRKQPPQHNYEHDYDEELEM